MKEQVIKLLDRLIHAADHGSLDDLCEVVRDARDIRDALVKEVTPSRAQEPE